MMFRSGVCARCCKGDFVGWFVCLQDMEKWAKLVNAQKEAANRPSRSAFESTAEPLLETAYTPSAHVEAPVQVQVQVQVRPCVLLSAISPLI